MAEEVILFRSLIDATSVINLVIGLEIATLINKTDLKTVWYAQGAGIISKTLLWI